MPLHGDWCQSLYPVPLLEDFDMNNAADKKKKPFVKPAKAGDSKATSQRSAAVTTAIANAKERRDAGNQKPENDPFEESFDEEIVVVEQPAAEQLITQQLCADFGESVAVVVALMFAHDWRFSKSDDEDVRAAGAAQKEEILKQLGELDPAAANAVWDTIAPEYASRPFVAIGPAREAEQSTIDAVLTNDDVDAAIQRAQDESEQPDGTSVVLAVQNSYAEPGSDDDVLEAVRSEASSFWGWVSTVHAGVAEYAAASAGNANSLFRRLVNRTSSIHEAVDNSGPVISFRRNGQKIMERLAAGAIQAGSWIIFVGVTGCLYVVGFGVTVILGCMHAITWPVAFVIASALELYDTVTGGISWLTGWSTENEAEMEVAGLAAE